MSSTSESSSSSSESSSESDHKNKNITSIFSSFLRVHDHHESTKHLEEEKDAEHVKQRNNLASKFLYRVNSVGKRKKPKSKKMYSDELDLLSDAMQITDHPDYSDLPDPELPDEEDSYSISDEVEDMKLFMEEGHWSEMDYSHWKNIPFQENVRVRVYGATNLGEPGKKCIPRLNIRVRTSYGKLKYLSKPVDDRFEEEGYTSFGVDVIFPWNEHYSQYKKKHLTIEIWEERSLVDELLGKLKIPYQDIELYRERQTVPLLGSKAKKAVKTGAEIDLELKKIPVGELGNHQENPPNNYLTVLVVEARGLEITTHPQVRIHYGKVRQKTKEHVSAENPVWSGCVLRFKRTDSRFMVVDLWRIGTVVNKCVGRVKVPLHPENDNTFVEDWYDVYKYEKEENVTEMNEADEALEEIVEEIDELLEQEVPDDVEVVGRIHLRIYQYCQPDPVQCDDLGVSVYPYVCHRPLIKPGDAILFAGGTYISSIIKSFANSPVSHIGYVLRLPDPKNNNELSLFVVESDQIEEGDHFTNEKTDGININLLDSRMHSYSGNMILHCPRREPLTHDQEMDLVAYALNMKLQNVPFDIQQLVGAGLGIPQTEDLSAVFCSEFVAAGLRQVGELNKDVNVSEISPFEVANLPIFDQDSNLLRFQLRQMHHTPLI
eukprot:TRINITY_DN7081_c0_g1_i1.p1 TRINITY_DN7081_c0_g1~~TRINITY_DN7081_c0_g1_i1.p1  ORF type:complete len:660 (-),score=165.78 TRINITY_DN7081_c0_g1_i1:21-2000(-)